MKATSGEKRQAKNTYHHTSLYVLLITSISKRLKLQLVERFTKNISEHLD